MFSHQIAQRKREFEVRKKETKRKSYIKQTKKPPPTPLSFFFKFFFGLNFFVVGLNKFAD